MVLIWVLCATLFVPDDTNTASALCRLGVVRQAAGRYSEAAALYNRAIPMLNSPADLATVWDRLGSAYYSQRLFSKAERALLKSISYAESAETLSSLAAVYRDERRLREAATAGERASAILENNQGPLLASVLSILGTIYLDMGRFEEAVAAQKRGLAVLEKDAIANRTQIVFLLNNLASTYTREKHHRPAMEALAKAADLVEKGAVLDAAEKSRILTNYANSLQKNGFKDRARAARAEARSILESAPADTGRFTVDASELRREPR